MFALTPLSLLIPLTFFISIILHPSHFICLFLSLILYCSILVFPPTVYSLSPTLSIFFRLRTFSPFSSSELLYYLKFLSVTNALWVEKAGVRGCPYEALLVPAQSPGICWLMSNPTRALWSFLTSLHPLCTHTQPSILCVHTKIQHISKYVSVGRNWSFYGSHLWHYMPPTPQRYAASSMFYRKQQTLIHYAGVGDCIHYRRFTWDTPAGRSTMDRQDK